MLQKIKKEKLRAVVTHAFNPFVCCECEVALYCLPKTKKDTQHVLSAFRFLMFIGASAGTHCITLRMPHKLQCQLDHTTQ